MRLSTSLRSPIDRRLYQFTALPTVPDELESLTDEALTTHRAEVLARCRSRSTWRDPGCAGQPAVREREWPGSMTRATRRSSGL